MLLIGLSMEQKQTEIVGYINKHNIKKVIVFYPLEFPLELPQLPCPVQLVDYDEIIMYRTFYPLLDEIDDGYMLIVHELLRDRNRNNLTFNCLRHYLNQCGHQIIFEYFPFIENVSDFMSLLDFDTRSKYKGSSFDPGMLREEQVQCVPHHYTLAVEQVPLLADAAQCYEAEKKRLFDTLGNKSPDTIPRNLHVWCGRYKKLAIRPELEYVSRNSRFKLSNVVPYHSVRIGGRYILLDFMYSRLKMNDFLRLTGQKDLTYLSTGFCVDRVYIEAFQAWKDRLEEFYAQASIYTTER